MLAQGVVSVVVALTVAVSGGGRVTSKPAGIHCKPGCKTHVHRGAKVTLSATPSSGHVFSHWSAPCGRAKTCKVTMSRARVVRAYFKVKPKPPPPPPPAPKPGHYAGTYTDGTFFRLDLAGTTVANVGFDFNGKCSDGGTSADAGVTLAGPYTVGADGSFSGNGSITFSNSVVTATFSGTVTTTGSASGTLNVGITFSGGTTCTSTGTWTAQLQG